MRDRGDQNKPYRNRMQVDKKKRFVAKGGLGKTIKPLFVSRGRNRHTPTRKSEAEAAAERDTFTRMEQEGKRGRGKKKKNEKKDEARERQLLYLAKYRSGRTQTGV